MTEFDYQAYLASREWALLKEKVRLRSLGECERCGRAPYEETHHLTYARIGHENLEDLLALCKGCHRYLSAKSSDDPVDIPLSPTPIPLTHGGWAWPELDQLHCPVCKFEYVHLRGIRTIATGDDYEAGFVRGCAIRIHFYCESSHHFSLDMGFHKGGTFVRVAPETVLESWGEDMPRKCSECPISDLPPKISELQAV